MNSYKVVAIIAFLLIGYNLYGEWKQVHYEQFEEFSTINCTNPNNCFASLHHGGGFEGAGWSLLKSTDQGRTWTLLFKSKNVYEQEEPQIFYVNECVSPRPDYYFVASDDGAIILKSTDGGKTFRKLILNSIWGGYIDNFAMWDSSYGFATSKNNYYTTTDGWETFETHPFPVDKSGFYQPLFMDSNTVAMMRYTRPPLDTHNHMTFMKYYMKENKWDTLFYFGAEYKQWLDAPKHIYFVNDSLGFSCGSGVSSSSLPTGHYYDIIYKTTDGGENWELIHKELKYPEKGFYNNIAFADENNGITVGYWGKIAMTNDGGETWVYERPEAMEHCRKMLVTWAGHTPLIGTWDAGIFRYEGDFFNFPEDTSEEYSPIIQADDYDFGEYDISNEDSLSIKLKIRNASSDANLEVTGYSELTDSAFSTDLPSLESHFILIKPQDDFEYTVYFSPKEERDYRDSIVFYSNAEDSDRVAYFTGEGIDTTTSVIEFDGGTLELGVYYSQSLLRVLVDKTNASNISINLYDINGLLMLNESGSLCCGLNKFDIDLTRLKSGVYVYGIEIDGISVKTGKINIVR